MFVLICSYLAPEYFQHGKVSDKTDVYAFGVVLLELISGRKPIEARGAGEENLVVWVGCCFYFCLNIFSSISFLIVGSSVPQLTSDKDQ